VKRDKLLAELGWPEDGQLLWTIAQELHEQHLIWAFGQFVYPDAQATYRGLVWETKRGFTRESRFIDYLIAEWETTSVEFKREIHLGTAGEKAEFIKDVIALANTQASGKRWLITGFDDKTREYYGPPDPTVTQDRIEDILSCYTDPIINV